MKRTLKPTVRIMLECITTFLAVCLISINDFELTAIPLILLVLLVVAFNLKILEKY